MCVQASTLELALWAGSAAAKCGAADRGAHQGDFSRS